MKSADEIREIINTNLNKTGAGSISKADIFNTMMDIVDTFESEINQLTNEVIFGDEEYVDLGLPSGNLWAKRNLGASTAEDMGMYFTWGSIIGHSDLEEYAFSETEYSESDASKIQCDLNFHTDAVKVNLQHKWRMPSKDDFQELIENTIIEFTESNGIKGVKLTGKNDAYIFIPTTGYLDTDAPYEIGSKVILWSSSISTTDINRASLFEISADKERVDDAPRFIGLNIRGIVRKH